MNNYTIIIKPIITEKSNNELALNRYTFKVARTATKVDIRKAIEKTYNVKVKKVNTANFEGKGRHYGRVVGKQSDWKKAIVVLAEGHKIEALVGR
jgi:large subunit ribosomal protein L23